MCVFCVIFFFFKQKTAYEMRISDWSSDVCSSDLAVWIYQSICLLAAAIKLSNVAVASLHQEALTAVNAPERRCWARCNGPWCAPLAPSGQVSEERTTIVTEGAAHRAWHWRFRYRPPSSAPEIGRAHV